MAIQESRHFEGYEEPCARAQKLNSVSSEEALLFAAEGSQSNEQSTRLEQSRPALQESREFRIKLNSRLRRDSNPYQADQRSRTRGSTGHPTDMRSQKTDYFQTSVESALLKKEKVFKRASLGCQDSIPPEARQEELAEHFGGELPRTPSQAPQEPSKPDCSRSNAAYSIEEESESPSESIQVLEAAHNPKSRSSLDDRGPTLVQDN